MSSNDEIADLKARVPLVQLIGLQLRNGKALCPFHKERTPSFHVFPDAFHCFACGIHGDHIDWLKQHKGTSKNSSRQVATNLTR